METKFCPSCRQERALEGFKLVATSSKQHRRCKCAMCLARKSATIYGKTNDTARTAKGTT
jgi:hypothetical protein